MHFSTIIIAALAGVASAGPVSKRQGATCPEVDNIPACGTPCILEAFATLGCAENDYVCGCSNFSELRSAASSCVISSCGLLGAAGVLSAAQAVCNACGTA